MLQTKFVVTVRAPYGESTLIQGFATEAKALAFAARLRKGVRYERSEMSGRDLPNKIFEVEALPFGE